MKFSGVAKLLVLTCLSTMCTIGCTATGKQVALEQGQEQEGRALGSDEERRSQASENEDTPPPVRDVDSTPESSSRVPSDEEAISEDAPSAGAISADATPDDTRPAEEVTRVRDLRGVVAGTVDMVDLLDPHGVAYVYILDDDGEGTADELAHELGFGWMSARHKLYCAHELVEFARYLRSVHLESRNSSDLGLGVHCSGRSCSVRAVEGHQGSLFLRYNERNRIHEVEISGFGMGVPPEDGRERIRKWLKAKKAELDEQRCPEKK